MNKLFGALLVIFYWKNKSLSVARVFKTNFKTISPRQILYWRQFLIKQVASCWPQVCEFYVLMYVIVHCMVLHGGHFCVLCHGFTVLAVALYPSEWLILSWKWHNNSRNTRNIPLLHCTGLFPFPGDTSTLFLFNYLMDCCRVSL